MTHVIESTPRRAESAQHPGSAQRYRNLILGAVAILFLAMAMLTSYSSAFGNPTPNDVHLAVTGDASAIVALEQQGSLELTVVTSAANARDAVLDRDVDGALVLPAPGENAEVSTYIASGGGRGLGQAISGIGTSVAAKLSATNTTTDLAPLPAKDPVGSVEFYAILFVGLGAALGATVFGRILGAVDTAATLVERSVVLVLYTAVLAGLITAWIDSALGAVTVEPGAVFAVLWLTGVAIGGAVTGVAALGGMNAALVLTLALVILGNTSSGGPLGIHVLNDFFQALHHVFPQGGALDLLRSVQYFDGAAVSAPIVRLGIWAAAGILLTLAAMLLRNRREAATRPEGGAGTELGHFTPAAPTNSAPQFAELTTASAFIPLAPSP